MCCREHPGFLKARSCREIRGDPELVDQDTVRRTEPMIFWQGTPRHLPLQLDPHAGLDDVELERGTLVYGDGATDIDLRNMMRDQNRFDGQ